MWILWIGITSDVFSCCDFCLFKQEGSLYSPCASVVWWSKAHMHQFSKAMHYCYNRGYQVSGSDIKWWKGASIYSEERVARISF